MKIVTAAEMREIDRATSERFGVPSLTLMETAGAGVAGFVLDRYATAKRIAVLCGKGNNGGDGFVIARKLHEAGRDVRVILLADPADLRGDAAAMFQKMPVKSLVVKSAEELKSETVRDALAADLLVDAILGTGFKPPVEGLYADAIQAINASPVPVVAADIPSGADADAMAEQPGVIARSDAIVTFTAPRPAHLFGSLTRGPVVVAPIGSPAEAITSSLNLQVTTAAEVTPLLGPRSATAHKGSFGHVLVLGGSYGKAGAAAMAGMAALRSGAGLVSVAVPRSVLHTVAGFMPELMTEPLPETEMGTLSMRAFEFGVLDNLMVGREATAIGPGASRHPETAELVRTCVQRYRGPLIIDADGLNAFEGCDEHLDGHAREVVITPHPGEMARLAGTTVATVEKDRLQVARVFARDHAVMVVLKGHRTLIVDPSGSAWVNATGNPGMATGGTGDILTGMIAGLIAQNPQRLGEAVRAAVYLHGLAGDLARDSFGEQCMTATDLLTFLPEAYRRARARAQEPVVEIST